MPQPNVDRLRSIKTLPQLAAYLRDELDWPIQADDAEDIAFDYTASELGIDEKAAVRIKEIKQLRPLRSNQPWGIFFINFEKKRLPVVVMRLILRALVLTKRASVSKAERQAWQARDLLFISAYGEDTDRAITFAHFVENPSNDLAELRVLGWDDDDTPLHMEYVARMLQEKLHWDDSVAADPESWRKRWSEAFVLRHRHVIRTSEELAQALAMLARNLRGRIRTILRMETGDGQIRTLQRAFQIGLIHDLDDDGFADMFAQTVAYGLFSLAARRTVPGEGTAFVKEDLTHYFTSPFLKEMLGVFLGLKSYKGKIDFDELGVSDVTDLLTSPDTHMEVVLADFNNKTRGEDPVVHFYEHFLSAYNKELKIQRGVFYTPQPVVSYIVRSVHELLQTEFDLVDGLADTTTWGEMVKKRPGLKLPPLTDEPGEERTISPDEPFVQILDPATGTATFLVEVIDVVHRSLGAKWKQQRLTEAQQRAAWNDYVPQHLLPRLHAFELMMAPYAIAHMKIGLKLAETGYRFGTEERARIYLTNALEPKVKQLPQIGFDALAREAAEVNEIKWYKRFTVVIGNPPYARHSSNPSKDDDGRLTFIGRLVEEYKEGCPELRKPAQAKYLQDDYVKFTRFAEYCVVAAGVGVVGLITSHGFLDNPTFRGMRRHLLGRLTKAVVLDLHGNANRKERAPDGSQDKNVFDIKQGVAILAAVRLPNRSSCDVLHGDLWGSRESKYRSLATSTGKALSTTPLSPKPPQFSLRPRDETNEAEYLVFPSITEVFSENGDPAPGIVTTHDSFAVAFTEQEIVANVETLLRTKNEDEAREHFRLCTQDQWKYSVAKRELADGKWRKKVIALHYRPFDTRFTVYDSNVAVHRRSRVTQHLLSGGNVALLTSRMTKGEIFKHVQVTHLVPEVICMSPTTSNNGFVFPLWLKANIAQPTQSNLFGDSKRLNLGREFLTLLCSVLRLKPAGAFGVPADLTPQDIFHYAYAVFHSPGYRKRYSEFLKIDFPRLPLTGNLELFRALARLGGELTTLHLLESAKIAQPITEFIGGQNPEVEKISWSRNTAWVDKAQTTGFRGVREEVWKFHIGGYQVCEKWLKDRRGRTLSKDDIAHYHKIVIALSETIRLMAEIDRVIDQHGGWPRAFATTVVADETTSLSPAAAPPAARDDLGIQTEDELPLG